MDIGHIIPHIEALVFASDKPLTPIDITELINNAFGFMDDKITMDQVESAIEGIVEKYNAEFYPFEMKQSGGGWQFLTKKEYHKTVAQLNGEKFLKRLSTAALETLAIIAYKQPLTKSDIESIRGVNCDYSIQKLLEKELIIISGRNEDMPGKPLIYNTSRSFMDYFGINSPEDLPKLKEIFDEAMVNPTVIGQGDERSGNTEEQAADSESQQTPVLLVSESGELLEGASLPGETADAGVDEWPVSADTDGDERANPGSENEPGAGASASADADSNEWPVSADTDNDERANPESDISTDAAESAGSDHDDIPADTALQSDDHSDNDAQTDTVSAADDNTGSDNNEGDSQDEESDSGDTQDPEGDDDTKR